MPVAGPQGMQTNWTGRLRPVKSVESLVSSPLYNPVTHTEDKENGNLDCGPATSVIEEIETSMSKSSPASPVTTDVQFHPPPLSSMDSKHLQNPKTHSR